MFRTYLDTIIFTDDCMKVFVVFAQRICMVAQKDVCLLCLAYGCHVSSIEVLFLSIGIQFCLEEHALHGRKVYLSWSQGLPYRVARSEIAR